MMYLYDNSIVHDLEQSLAGGDSVVRVISPEQIVGLAAQIQNDEIHLPIIALERNDYSIDTDRLNFSRAHFGLQTVIDLKTNELYYERAVPVNLSYGITVLTSNQIDMDEIIKELVFKYIDMYYLPIQLPYESKRRIRFGIRVEADSIEKRSGASEYIESGQLYQTMIPVVCEGAVLLHYTPVHLKRTAYEVVAE